MYHLKQNTGRNIASRLNKVIVPILISDHNIPLTFYVNMQITFDIYVSSIKYRYFLKHNSSRILYNAF